MEARNGESKATLVQRKNGSCATIQIQPKPSLNWVEPFPHPPSVVKKTSAVKKAKGREKPVICTINDCGRRFSSDNSLRNHIRRKHSSRAMMRNRLANLNRPPMAINANTYLRMPLQRATPSRKNLSQNLLPAPMVPSNFSPPREMGSAPKTIEGSSTHERNVSHEIQFAAMLSQIQQKNSSRCINESPNCTLSPTSTQAMLSQVTEKPFCGTVDELKNLIASRICEISIKLACKEAQVASPVYLGGNAPSTFGSPATDELPENEINFFRKIAWPVESASENWLGKTLQHGQWEGCHGVADQLKQNAKSPENVY